MKEDTNFASLANLGRVTGTLTIYLQARDQSDLSFLSCLHTVDRGLRIRSNQKLESTEGLENLQKIGFLEVEDNWNLRVITDFDQIHELGSLTLRANPALEQIDLDSVQTVKSFMHIGACAWQDGAAGHFALTDLAGFSGLSTVDHIYIDGNEALVSADILDALVANGDPMPLNGASVRFNPLLSEEDIHAQLDALGVENRHVCGNEGGMTECECPPVGE